MNFMKRDNPVTIMADSAPSTLQVGEGYLFFWGSYAALKAAAYKPILEAVQQAGVKWEIDSYIGDVATHMDGLRIDDVSLYVVLDTTGRIKYEGSKGLKTLTIKELVSMIKRRKNIIAKEEQARLKQLAPKTPEVSYFLR